jgi:hypothetical protein
MYAGRTLFSQVMDFVPWTIFDRIDRKYGGDLRVRTLRCTEQFRVMAFAQATYRESLREIEACLGAQPSKLCAPWDCASRLQNQHWLTPTSYAIGRIWFDLAAVLIKRARKLYSKTTLALISPTRSMRSTAQQSICAFAVSVS